MGVSKSVNLKNAKDEIYASSLAKQIDCTYSHVVKILQEMERSGLINFEKQGRLKLLTLTKKGQEIAEHIDNIRLSL
jgi:DNA-binding MarR family transcriptional regulator